MYTPWGKSQSEKKYADGVTFYSTAGHGGFILGAEREAIVRLMFPEFVPYACAGAYEEDCDWSIVALAFPDLFDDEALRSAVRTVHISLNLGGKPEFTDSRFKSVAAWLESSPVAADIRRRVDAFNAKINDSWEVGSMGTPPGWAPRGAWWCTVTRPRDRARKSVIFPDYPDKRFYTDAELAQLTAGVPQSAATAAPVAV